jgi:hypothetical protein
MCGFFRSVLGLFKPQPSEANRDPVPRGDGSNKRLDGAQAEVAFRVPGMS